MVPSLTASPRVTIERSVNAFHATHAESSARATWGCGAMIDRACGYGRNAGILYAVMTSDDDLAWVHSLEWGVFITLPYSVRVPRESLAARSGRFDVAQGRLSGRTPSECGVGGGVLARQIAIDHRVEAVLIVPGVANPGAVRIGGGNGFHFARRVIRVAQCTLGRLEHGNGWSRSVVSPVPKGEGPGAPSSWSGRVTGTGATRLGVTCPPNPHAEHGRGFTMLDGARTDGKTNALRCGWPMSENPDMGQPIILG